MNFDFVFPNRVYFAQDGYVFNMTTELAFKFSFLRNIICTQWKLEEAYNESVQVK